MLRPCNPYRKDTLRWSLMEGGLQGEFDGLSGWDDLTIKQIAEIFDKAEQVVRDAIKVIQRETGFCVPYTHVPRGGLRTPRKEMKRDG